MPDARVDCPRLISLVSVSVFLWASGRRTSRHGLVHASNISHQVTPYHRISIISPSFLENAPGSAPTLSLSITKNQRLAFNCIIVTKLLPSLIASSLYIYLLKPFFSQGCRHRLALCYALFSFVAKACSAAEIPPPTERVSVTRATHFIFLFQNRLLLVCLSDPTRPILYLCVVWTAC